MAKRKPTPTSTDLSASAVALAEFAAQILVATAKLGLNQKSIPDFPLDQTERARAAELPGLAATLKKKLQPNTDTISGTLSSTLTVADTANLALAVAETLHVVEPQQRMELLHIAQKLTDCIVDNVVPAVPAKRTAKPKAKKSKPTDTLYQFKITLRDTKPAIWRRIQVKDCTLDKLHEHIQTAMGWTNSHLHHFEIQGEYYGDPDLLDEGFGDFECIDSTKTNLSHILPQTDQHFAFSYEYDFGDSWEHEILFEGSPPVDPQAKYPRCLEGERARPPEDCGGVWGYHDLLEAIRNPQHPDHHDMLEWLGGPLDPEQFDANKATQAMKRGLPDW